MRSKRTIMLKGLVQVESDGDLPPETGVAIIGGGIVGVTAALFLAERGVPVCLFEKGEIAAEQSGRNWGWVRKMGRQSTDIGLAILAGEIWPTLAERSGEDLGFRVNGSLYPCDTEEEIEEQARWRREIGQPAGVESHLLDAARTAALLPGCKRPFKGALHTPSDGCAEPFQAAPGIALGARRAGARIYTNCAVRDLETAAGRISAVVTERGRVACDRVILATGAWSSLFLRHLGQRLPQLSLRASVCHLEGVAAPEICCSARDISFRMRQDGTCTFARRNRSTSELSPDHFRFFRDFLPTLRENREMVGLRASPGGFLRAWRDSRDWQAGEETVFERTRVLEAPGDPAILSQARDRLIEAFPVFAGMRVIQDWSGFIEGTPDAMPVIGPVPEHDGLLLATGFSGHGFGTGPAVGQLLTELAEGQTPSLDLEAFRFDRF
ncbi:NAD(P)/FAD-dependent oxidoreductase [Pseudodonghicola flavimaris]|uniref:FAD-binding oxidoreductase n=1 Tax=Pseudodonghicola flavimaris TaxID=3050036 RepID=A0ABT7F2T3_9RHOB|nr:FAD-binding oxidoreductase [Pseudodonghicola flavimaris]MDK3018898.1 FAD-binding oxidoreductase [Pseudodonghicola flavimaris]